MSQQLIDNDSALRLFFTEEVYLVPDETKLENSPQADVQEPVASYQTAKENVPVERAEERKKYEFAYKGKYGKGIVILGNDATTEDASTPEGMQVLANLMKAINVSGADVAVFNYAKYAGATFDDLYGFFKCNLVLAFGVSGDELKVANQGMHQFTEHQQGRIIFTHNLAQLASDVASKKLLWNTLKTLI